MQKIEKKAPNLVFLHHFWSKRASIRQKYIWWKFLDKFDKFYNSTPAQVLWCVVWFVEKMSQNRPKYFEIELPLHYIYTVGPRYKSTSVEEHTSVVEPKACWRDFLFNKKWGFKSQVFRQKLDRRASNYGKCSPK